MSRDPGVFEEYESPLVEPTNAQSVLRTGGKCSQAQEIFAWVGQFSRPDE